MSSIHQTPLVSPHQVMRLSPHQVLLLKTTGTWEFVLRSRWTSSAAHGPARVDWSPPDSSPRDFAFLTNSFIDPGNVDWATLTPDLRPFEVGAVVEFVYTTTFGDAAGKTMTFQKAQYRTTPQTTFPFTYDSAEWTDIPGATVATFTVNIDDLILDITPDFHEIHIIALYTVSP